MVTRIKIRVVATVFCLSYLWELCESNSFFQVSNDQNSQTDNFPLSILNQQNSPHVSRDKHWHNSGDGPLGHRKKLRKGRRNRTGRKKSRKHHRRRNKTHDGNGEQPFMVKNSDVEAFNLQDSLLKSDKTEFSFPVLNNAAPLPEKVDVAPIPIPVKEPDNSPQLSPQVVQPQPVPPIANEAKTGKSPIIEPVKSVVPVVEKKPEVKIPDIPEGWMRKDLKMEDVAEDSLISLVQEKRSNPESPPQPSPPEQEQDRQQQGGRGVERQNEGSRKVSLLDFKPSNNPPTPSRPPGKYHLLDFPWGKGNEKDDDNKNEIESQDKYNEVCKTRENMEKKKQCTDPDGDNEVEAEARAASVSNLDLENLIDVGENRLLPSQVRARYLHSVGAQNRKLAIAILTETIFDLKRPPLEPEIGFRLLDTTKAIFSKICPNNVIPRMFFEMAVNAFKTLHRIVSPDRLGFLTEAEWKLLNEILTTCQETSELAYYIQSTCKEDVWAVNTSSNILCLGTMNVRGTPVSTVCHQTNIDVFDPLLDIIWLMLEGVKANCFNSFQGNSRLFHRYSLAIMDLYTRPLKYRWPLQNKDNIFWERILGPNLDLYMTNLDKCVHHIVQTSPLEFRTPRFFNIHTVRLSHTYMDAFLN